MIFDWVGCEFVVLVDVDLLLLYLFVIEDVVKMVVVFVLYFGCLKRDFEMLICELCDVGKCFVWFDCKVLCDVVEVLCEFDIQGVGFICESCCFYLYGCFVVVIFGFVGIDLKGFFGFEVFYDLIVCGCVVECQVVCDVGKDLVVVLVVFD